MSAGATAHGGSGLNRPEPRPLVFPDDVARKRLRLTVACGIGALIVLVGCFIIIEIVAAHAGSAVGNAAGSVHTYLGSDWAMRMLAGLLLAPIPFVVYSMLLSAGVLRSRNGMRVDSSGIHLSSRLRDRTLSWDSVRGHFDVVITDYPSDHPSDPSRTRTLIRTAVLAGGDRIELPWLDVTGADEHQAQERVRQHAVNILDRDPHPEAPPVAEGADRERPAVLVMERVGAGGAGGTRAGAGGVVDPVGADGAGGGALSAVVRRLFLIVPLLALAGEILSFLWREPGYVLAYAIVPGTVAVVDVCALVYLVVMFAWMYEPTYVVAEPSGVTVRGRQGSRRGKYTLPWNEVRGRLEAGAVKVTAGWEARVVCHAGLGDVVLTGASLLAADERSAMRMARERIALISSYDPAVPVGG